MPTHRAHPRADASPRFWYEVIALASVSSSRCAAEVADKLWSAPELILPAIASGALGCLLGKKSPWFFAVTLPIGLVRVLGAAGELFDPFVGPATQREVGPRYALHVGMAVAVVLLGHSLGFLAWRSRKRSAAPLSGSN